MTARSRLGEWLCAALLAVATISIARAEATFDIPAGAHFSQAKLAKIADFFNAEIAQGKIPGAVLVIRQHGKLVYTGLFGVRDVATRLPMSQDTIFRISSMTKPITSVAAMMLIDRGKLKLDDAVAEYIPAFADMKVGVEKPTPGGGKALERVPLKRPITILDLLRHTSGITYGFYGDSLVRKAYAAASLFDGDPDNAAFAARIAKLPLQEQPGTLWDYGHSTDILGRVIEVVSGKSLYQFEKENLLDPLGMSDTAFYVHDPAARDRLAQPMPNDGDLSVGYELDPLTPRRREAGTGGMVSTPHDYARFAQMILNGGSLDGKRYLGAQTFAQMTRDHVGPDSGVARDYFYFPGDGFGFGLGFGVRTDPGNARPPPPGSPGELKWDGASGCYFVIDRKQDMLFVLMEQTPSERQRIQSTVKQLVYEALEN
ncbi:MAG: serine hydrolase domain-containing protein [Xanthobacteraceae bacterium]